MSLPLSLALSLLATQVAVEGEDGLVAPVVVRLLDDGYRVVPSREDAFGSLIVRQDDDGSVVLRAVGIGGERQERVPAGTRPLVELEVMQRAPLLLERVGAERDVETEGLPGAVVLDVQGTAPAMRLAEWRVQLTGALLERGFALVERSREGDRRACVYVDDDGGASLLIARGGRCPIETSREGALPLARSADLSDALTADAAEAAPRDDAPRGHPLLGRRAPATPAYWSPPDLSRPRFGLGLQLGGLLGTGMALGPRADVVWPLWRPLVLLASSSLVGGPMPTGYAVVQGAAAAGVGLEIAVVPWLSTRGGVQVGLDVVGRSRLDSPDRFASDVVVVGPSLVVPVTVTWYPLSGIAVEMSAFTGATFASVPDVGSQLVPQAGLSLSVAWLGSGNFLADGG